MIEQEAREHAARLIREEVYGTEFCVVYDDDALVDEDDDTQRRIHDLILSARVEVSW